MSVTTQLKTSNSNCGYIWKYKILFTNKSQNDATTNDTISNPICSANDDSFSIFSFWLSHDLHESIGRLVH